MVMQNYNNIIYTSYCIPIDIMGLIGDKRMLIDKIGHVGQDRCVFGEDKV